MLKRNLPGGKNRFRYLINRAFEEADEGDRGAALAFLDQAISEGYTPTVKMKKQLMYKIRMGNMSSENLSLTQTQDHHVEGQSQPDAEPNP